MRADRFGPAIQRDLLIGELKRLRMYRGETQEQVARAREWSVSKFIRIENGTTHISKSDLEALLRHYGVTDEERINELTTLARDAREPGWWEYYDLGNDKPFRAYLGYEDGASSIRIFQGLMLPALLQTESYSRLVSEAYQAPSSIDNSVRLRLERQRRVAARSPEQNYILDEAVIRRRFGDVMPDQLRHLVYIAQKPSVTIHVVPFAAGSHFGLLGPFTLLGFDAPLDDVLYLENPRGGNLLIAGRETVGAVFPDGTAEEIARYEDGFESLKKLALAPEESLQLIESIAQEFS
jgi:transcriptional regulator with XRE-family HTH domain